MFITRVFEHGIMSRGAELAYYFLFSFLPLIIFVAALISAMKIDISSFAGLENLIPGGCSVLYRSIITISLEQKTRD